MGSYASRIPGAANGVLLFAGIALRSPFCGEFRLAGRVAQPLLQSTFDLVADTRDAIRVDPDHAVPFRAGHIVGLACHPLGGTIDCKLRITDDLAEAFLQDPLNLVADALKAIAVYDTPL